MAFPDSSKKAPNVFVEVFDDTGSPIVVTSSGTSYGPVIVNPPAPPPPPPPPPVPVVDFSGTPLSGVEPLSVAFTDLSTNSPTSWSWDFENNGSTDSILQNPTHIYPSAGTYSVKLTATNAGGSGMMVKTSYIVVTVPTISNIRWYEPPTDSNGTLVIGNPISVEVIFPLYINYGNFSASNGRDGDVGIKGYISESNPFTVPFEIVVYPAPQTYPDTASSYVTLTTGTVVDYDTIRLGAGNVGDTPGTVGPMPVATTRLYSFVPLNDYFNTKYYLPMRPGDKMWCVGAGFLGYNKAFTITIVIGPDKDNGDQYLCYGSDEGFGTLNIDTSIQRLPNVGVR